VNEEVERNMDDNNWMY